MKEQTGDVFLSVKESAAVVDSTSNDEVVTKRGKIEGIFGDGDEGEDMMVDAVSIKVKVDDHVVTRIDLGGKVGFNGVMEEGLERETVTGDQVMEDASVGKKVGDDLVENKVVTLENVEVVVSEESVEVVKEVIQGNVVTNLASGSDCDDQRSRNGPAVGDSKMDSEPSSKEPEAGGGGIEVSESVQVVANEDHVVEEKSQKETDVLNSSKIVESIEGRVVAVEEGLVSKDKAEDGDSNQSSLPEVVDRGAGGDNVLVSSKSIANQDGVDQSNKESFQSTVEVTTSCAQNSGNGDSKLDLESINADPLICMKPESCVMNEKTVKDKILDSTKITASLTIVDEVVVEGCLVGKGETQYTTGERAGVDENAENLDQKAAVNQMVNDEISQSTIEASTDNASKSEDSKMDDEPQVTEGEFDVKDKKDDPKRGLNKETVEQPTGSVQEVTDGDHVMDEKSVKDDVLDSSNVSRSLTMASLGLEDVDVVVVDEGLEEQNEAHDSDSVELSLVCPDNKSSSIEVVNVGTGEVDQKVEVDPTSRDENSYSTILTDEVAACSEVVDTDVGVQISKGEPAAKGGDLSNFEEEQVLIANPSTEGNEIPSSHIGFPDSTVGVPSTGGSHGVFPANSEFSYEEAHMDRGEDAGMDINEVLGWKDEIPTMQEDEPMVDPIKKREAMDSISDVLEKQPTPHTETVVAKPSINVGAVIQKVANQPSVQPLKGELAHHVAGDTASSQKIGNQAEMLSQLNLAAQDPMKGYSFTNNIIPFFKSHRAAVLSESRKRKTSNEIELDEFEFDDVNDSYWTDRTIQNHTEEQVLQDNPNVSGGHQIVALEQEKPPVKPTRRSNKKRFFSSNHEIEAKEQSELIVKRQQNLATEVLMKFADGIYFPSEIHLNKMFRRFGPLMESETVVDRQSGHARVVFKRCSDAEVAHSSAGAINIFGSISVNYELNYTPLISYKPLPLPLTQDPPHA